MKHMQMIITIVCILYVTASCTTQKVAYRERFEEAKGYALYACIAHMNKFVDSTSVINKDYSGEYFVQLSNLSLEEIIRIKEYVDKKCMNYWSISHNSEGNMIAYSTWKFYNSKDLDNFIHKTLRKNTVCLILIGLSAVFRRINGITMSAELLYQQKNVH